MVNRNGPIIDMTPDGRIVEPAKPSISMILLRLAAFALALCLAAVMFWAALFVIPILLLLGLVGYFAFRMQIRRNL